MTIFEVSFDLLRMILNQNLIRTQTNNEVEKRVLDIHHKLKSDMKKAFFENTILEIYVNNIDRFIENPKEAKNIYFGQIEIAYWFQIYLHDNPTMENKNVSLVVRKYHKFTYESNQYLHYLMSTVCLTKNKGRSIHFPKLDSLLSDKPRKYAKHARESVTQTLLGISQQKMLRLQPNVNGIVQYKMAKNIEI